MGTSKSNAGPKNHSPLLPPWAPKPPSLPSNPLNPDDEANNDNQPEENDSKEGETPVLENLQKARRDLTNYTKTKTRQSFKKAARSYVNTYGGGRRASKTATSGKSTGGIFAGFLSNVANQGIRETLNSLGLEKYTGEPIDFILTKIADIIAPSSITNEEAAAREAILDTLEYIYETYEMEGKELTDLDSLQKEDMELAIKEYVSSYIFNRWLHELGIKVEEHATSIRDVIKIEKEGKLYIKEAVNLDFSKFNILKVNFNSKQGKKIIDNIFDEAYILIEDL